MDEHYPVYGIQLYTSGRQMVTIEEGPHLMGIIKVVTRKLVGNDGMRARGGMSGLRLHCARGLFSPWAKARRGGYIHVCYA